MIKEQEIGIIGAIGASGFVGEKVVECFRKDNVFVITPSSKEVDITNPSLVDEFVRNFPGRAIVLLGGFAKVEGKGGAEENPDEAMKVNYYGTRNVAEAARKYNKFLVYISTDFVFSGTDDYRGPYWPDSKTADINSSHIGVYAKSKILAEQAVQSILDDFAIVRISYPFGNYRSEKDFLKKTVGLIKNGYALFSDQRITPTYISDLAIAIMKIIEEERKGIFHVVTFPVTTPFEFGKYVAHVMNLNEEIKEGSLREYMKGKTPKPLLGGLVPTPDLVRKNRRHWMTSVDEFIVSLG